MTCTHGPSSLLTMAGQRLRETLQGARLSSLRPSSESRERETQDCLTQPSQDEKQAMAVSADTLPAVHANTSSGQRQALPKKFWGQLVPAK